MSVQAAEKVHIAGGTATELHQAPVVGGSSLYLAVKRVFDVVGSALLGVLLFLPMLLVALVIRLDSPGPAIFRQERMGRHGKPFVMYKFRTMRLDAPRDRASREYVDAKSYITRVGAFLRRSSIDELPQLFNILIGNMSFVGYRPVCLSEVKLNELREEYGVFAAKPGLTGLAQVQGRDNIAAEEKARYDVEYVQKRSVKLDIWCLWKTVRVVLSGDGAL